MELLNLKSILIGYYPLNTKEVYRLNKMLTPFRFGTFTGYEAIQGKNIQSIEDFRNKYLINKLTGEYEFINSHEFLELISKINTTLKQMVSQLKANGTNPNSLDYTFYVFKPNIQILRWYVSTKSIVNPTITEIVLYSNSNIKNYTSFNQNQLIELYSCFFLHQPQLNNKYYLINSLSSQFIII